MYSREDKLYLLEITWTWFWIWFLISNNVNSNVNDSLHLKYASLKAEKVFVESLVSKEGQIFSISKHLPLREDKLLLFQTNHLIRKLDIFPLSKIGWIKTAVRFPHFQKLPWKKYFNFLLFYYITHVIRLRFIYCV